MAKLGGLDLPQLFRMHGFSRGRLDLRNHALLHSTNIADAQAEEDFGTTSSRTGPPRQRRGHGAHTVLPVLQYGQVPRKFAW